MADEKFVKRNPFEPENKPHVAPKKLTTPESAVEPEQVTPAEPSTNLLGDLSKKKPAGKNFTVYLDLDVVAAADNLAKENGLSRSTVINTLLKGILLDK